MLTGVADTQRRSQAARDNLPLCWDRAVNWLFNRIESVYLREFTAAGSITLHRGHRQIWADGPRVMTIGTLTLSVGMESIHIVPFYHQPSRVTLILFNARDGREFEFFCDLESDYLQWMVVIEEVSLRRLIERYLPVKTRVLDEQVFSAILDESLHGRQGIFLLGRHDVVRMLGRMLDVLTSGEARGAVGRGAEAVQDRLGVMAEAVGRGLRRALRTRIPRFDASKRNG